MTQIELYQNGPDSLIADQDLRSSYVERKRGIIASGIIDSVDYSDAKNDFISGAIDKIRKDRDTGTVPEGFDQ
jgi:hypothetical protein